MVKSVFSGALSWHGTGKFAHNEIVSLSDKILCLKLSFRNAFCYLILTSSIDYPELESAAPTQYPQFLHALVYKGEPQLSTVDTTDYF